MHWLLTLFSTKEENMKFIFSGAPDMQEALKMMKGNTKKCVVSHKQIEPSNLFTTSEPPKY